MRLKAALIEENQMFEDWNIHSERYTLKAVVRRVLHMVRRTNYCAYSNGVPGYDGWHELPGFGVTAFVREDGSLQYRW